VLRGRARREAREEGVSEERSQAQQTNSRRARGPRGLEFRLALERSIRVMTNSRRSQGEKQWAGRGRETTARKPQNKKSPRPTPLTEREHVGGGSRGKIPDRDLVTLQRKRSELGDGTACQPPPHPFPSHALYITQRCDIAPVRGRACRWSLANIARDEWQALVRGDEP